MQKTEGVDVNEDKLIYLRKINPYLLILVYSSFFYFLHPQVTEVISFAMVQIGEIQFSSNNFIFNFVSKEASAQITFAAILLKIGVDKFVVQFLISWLLTLIPFFAIYEFIQESQYKYWYYFFFTSILIIFQIPNWYFYPYSFQIGFYSFGNTGFWIFILFFGLLLRNKPLAYFISGLLLSIHIPWGVLSLLFVMLNQHINKTNKSFNKYLLLGLCISIALLSLSYYFILHNELSGPESAILDKFNNLITLEKLTKEHYPFYAFDPFIWNNSHNPYIFHDGIINGLIIIFNLFLPSILVNLKLNETNQEFIRINAVIYLNFLSILVLIGLIYMELARLVPLPLVGALWRLIINRYLCVSSLISLIFMSIFLWNTLITKNRAIKFKFFLFLVAFIYILNFKYQGYVFLVVGLCYLMQISLQKEVIFKFNSNLLRVATIILMVGANTPTNDKYTTIFNFQNSDKVFDYLKNQQEGAILLAPNVQSNNGLEVTHISGHAHFLLSKLDYFDDGVSKSVYCYEPTKDYQLQIINTNKCFEERERGDWKKIFNQLNIGSVIVFKRHILNLDLVAQNELFSIYTIKKNRSKDELPK